MFLLLNAPPLRSLSDDSPLRFIRAFTEFISAIPCRHETPYAPMPVTRAIRSAGSRTVSS